MRGKPVSCVACQRVCTQPVWTGTAQRSRSGPATSGESAFVASFGRVCAVRCVRAWRQAAHRVSQNSSRWAHITVTAFAHGSSQRRTKVWLVAPVFDRSCAHLPFERSESCMGAPGPVSTLCVCPCRGCCTGGAQASGMAAGEHPTVVGRFSAHNDGCRPWACSSAYNVFAFVDLSNRTVLESNQSDLRGGVAQRRCMRADRPKTVTRGPKRSTTRFVASENSAG